MKVASAGDDDKATRSAPRAQSPESKVSAGASKTASAFQKGHKEKLQNEETQQRRSSQRTQKKTLKSGYGPVASSESRPRREIPTWKVPLTWPFSGVKRTTVNFEDLERLDDGNFLNDNLVNICLRRLERAYPDLADKVYIFNTYLYSTLTQAPNGRKTFNFDAVKRWTKKDDLFSYPFVIVPVNINLHWFVAIICNLPKFVLPEIIEDDDGLNAEQFPSDKQYQEPHSADFDPEQSPPRAPSQRFERMSLDEPTIPNADESSLAAAAISMDEIPDSEGERASKDAIIIDRRELPATASKLSSKRKGKKKLVPAGKKFDPNTPLIITLDSLGGAHSTEIKNLKDYVVAESNDKRNVTIDPKSIQGLTAKGIPEQTNMCDCGIYLIAYVEEFLKDPRRFVEKACSKELDVNNDFHGFDPLRKRDEIRDELLALEQEQTFVLRKAKIERIAAKRAAKAAAADASKKESLVTAEEEKATPVEVPTSAKEDLPNATKEESAVQSDKEADAVVVIHEDGIDQVHNEVEAAEPIPDEQEGEGEGEIARDDRPMGKAQDDNQGTEGILDGIMESARET